MEYIDYRKLYVLQDRVLELIFSQEQEFYLTGGAGLRVFYSAKRCSDDLGLPLKISKQNYGKNFL